MKKLNFACTAVLVGLLPACATVTKGTTDEVMIRSNVKDATVTTDLGYHGTVPANIEHKRKKTYTVTVEAEGYKSAEVFIDNKFSGSGAAGLAGNVLLGGVVGLAVDGISGSTLDHYPNDVFIELMPLGSSEEAKLVIAEPEQPVKERIEEIGEGDI